MASENTEARRERMRALWTKSDRRIAEILIEEGFAGATKRTKDGQQKQIATTIRNVYNDRLWWRKQWRAKARATEQDVNETRGEYLARLDSYASEALMLLDDPKLKGTPRVQALSELRQIEQAKAKAVGVAEVPPEAPDGDGASSAPYLGIVVNLDGTSDDAKHLIHEWTKNRK